MKKDCSSIIKEFRLFLKRISMHRSFRHNSLLKKLIFFLIFVILFVLLTLFNHRNQLCNPEEALWWFCPWPDPKTSVCSWDNHFPSLKPSKR